MLELKTCINFQMFSETYTTVEVPFKFRLNVGDILSVDSLMDAYEEVHIKQGETDEEKLEKIRYRKIKQISEANIEANGYVEVKRVYPIPNIVSYNGCDIIVDVEFINI